MTRRNIHLPDELWEQMGQYAEELGRREGRPGQVSTSEAVRRVLERFLARREK